MGGIALRHRMLAFGSLAAVAFLAGAADSAAAGSGPIAVPHEPLIVAAQTALWLFIAADALLLVGIVYALVTDRSLIREHPRKLSPLTYFAALVPTLLLLALLYLRPAGGLMPLLRLQQLGAPGSATPSAAGTAASTSGGNLVWLSVLIAGLIVTLFLAWLFWPAPRRKPPLRVPPRPGSAEESVVEGLDEGIDALRAIRDPRQAIIAAYSSMEGSMARAGLPRRRAETPVEFLARALRSLLGISADATRLTDLFEFAKFSQHEVDESMRADALDALQSIRDRLTAAPAT